MRIAKPILLVITPVGLLIGLEEAWRLAGGLVVLLFALIALFGVAIMTVVMTVRRESRSAESQAVDALQRAARPRDGEES